MPEARGGRGRRGVRVRVSGEAVRRGGGGVGERGGEAGCANAFRLV